ncbi:phage portal protein [Micromonosporaceae bacterium B7E4]
MLPDTELGWVNHLARLHDAEIPELRALDDEYELRAPKSYMHPEIYREIGDRLSQVVIAWPMLVADTVEERLEPEGFRLPNSADADDELWRVWQSNNADEESQLGRLDALVMKRSYITVGTNEDDGDTPLMAFESPLEMYADTDPRTRKVRAALRRYSDHTDSLVRLPEYYATLQLPNVTVWYDRGPEGWRETGRDVHNLGEVAVVPVVNRGRTAERCGRSEFAPILPLAHAANKIATDMMTASEFVALPLRGLFGIGPQDLEDADGNKMTALQAILGRLLTIPDDDGTARQFEFTPANLSNFHETINQLARLVASLGALPPHFLGFTTDNPASADAIRSSEARLVKRAERKQVAFGGAYEQAMRLVRRLQDGDWDPSYRRLETIWRDAATPTIAQKADAAQKLHAQGISTLRQTREDVGYTDGQIRRMEDEDEKTAREAAERDPIAQLARNQAGPPVEPVQA